MTISVDWENLVIESTASITDLPAFHATLRDYEDDTIGMIYPVTHTWKALDLGGGAYFYGCDLINGWQLKFVGAGPFQINGNLNGTIIDTGVQVERKTSAAYVTTAIGGSGPSAADIADAVWQQTTGAVVATRIAEAWGRLGLDPSKPLISGQTEISFGAIVMALTGNETSSTLTRQ
jgi:hypothetical protein